MSPRTLLAIIVIICAVPLSAWHADGHYRAASLAVKLSKGHLPAFFTKGRISIADVACDPDVFRNDALAQLRNQEGPEHYINPEKLGGQSLPPLREDYIALCMRLGVNPMQLGFLPYSVTEWEQRLTMAFAEYRAFPGKKQIGQKCLTYAGLMAHYAADLCMPLHVTMHHNGRLNADGSISFAGIHARVDALIGKIPVKQIPAIAEKSSSGFSNVWDGVMAQLAQSTALIDTVYSLQADIPDPERALPDSGAIVRFSQERLKESVLFVSKLFITAWDKSASIALPKWDLRGNEK